VNKFYLLHLGDLEDTEVRVIYIFAKPDSTSINTVITIQKEQNRVTQITIKQHLNE